MAAMGREELAAEVRAAREGMLDIVARMDDIVLQQNPRIVSDYAVKVGVWENKLLESQIAARRAKRRFELAQASANRGEAVDDVRLEAVLDGEFEQWQAQLSAAVAGYEAALEHQLGSRAMTPAESKELKRLYRILAKRLHPDLNPDDPERARYFELAQRAYENGNLDALRSIEVATAVFGPFEADVEVEGADELNAELALLQAQLALLHEKLETLVHERPYCLGELLDDPSWVAGQVQGLKDHIAQTQETTKTYEQRLADLLGRG